MSKIKTIKVEGVVYDIKAQYDGAGNNIESTYATKTELEHKADKTSVYTMQEVDNKLEAKQAMLIQGTNITLGEPDAEGKVTISASQPDITGLATKAEVTEGLATKLDTSTYNSEKANFALKSQIPDTSGLATKEQVDKKVDKESGKGLSEANYTELEKQKLQGVEDGANNYEHPTTAGNKHIPAGGTAGQILINNGDGSVKWGDNSGGGGSPIDYTGLEDIYSYGVEWDTTVADPALTRIGNPLLHKSLPIQSQYKGCVANKNVINYYLYPDNWAFKADGVTPSVLDGTDGTVRVHTPKFYGKSGSEGNKRWVRLCTIKMDDTWTEIPEMLVDAYKSTVDNTVSATPKAASVVNIATEFRGGGNRTANDTYLDTDAFRSDLGKPRTNISRATMRTYATNAGSEMMCYEYYKWIFYWAYVVEYANFNSQAAYNATLTSDGYHQGGLGDGITTWASSDWSNYNGYYPLTPCGYGNEIGNFTGLKDLVIPATTISDIVTVATKTFKMPRWRGFDNPFGDIWTNLDGIVIQRTAANQPSEVYTSTDPAEFTDVIGNKTVAGIEIASDGYTKAYDLGEKAEMIPSAVGGGATTYMCDHHYCSASSTTLRTLFVGGYAYCGAHAGLGCFYSDSGVGYAITDVGFRTINKI